MKIFLTVTELWHVQECLEKINQRGITWKLRKGEQSFLCATCRPDLIHIPINLHEDILNSYCVMERTRMLKDGQTAPCHNMCFFQNRRINRL